MSSTPDAPASSQEPGVPPIPPEPPIAPPAEPEGSDKGGVPVKPAPLLPSEFPFQDNNHPPVSDRPLFHNVVKCGLARLIHDERGKFENTHLPSYRVLMLGPVGITAKYIPGKTGAISLIISLGTILLSFMLGIFSSIPGSTAALLIISILACMRVFYEWYIHFAIKKNSGAHLTSRHFRAFRVYQWRVLMLRWIGIRYGFLSLVEAIFKLNQMAFEDVEERWSTARSRCVLNLTSARNLSQPGQDYFGPRDQEELDDLNRVSLLFYLPVSGGN